MAMNPLDAFDSPTEGITASVDVSLLALGNHTLFVRGQDMEGNWGDTIWAVVDVTGAPPLPPPATTMHVSDLDGVAEKLPQGNWEARVTITVHDTNDNPVSNATVTGDWSGGFSGPDSCVTDGSGQCTVTSGSMANNNKNATLTVSNVEDTLTYVQPDNHDTDGDSDGTSIQVDK